jgi:hypothetical protein
LTRISYVLALALFAAGCGGSQSTGPAAPVAEAVPAGPTVDPSKANLGYATRYVTDDAVLVAGFDVQAMRGSPLYAFLEGLLMRESDAAAKVDAFASRTGVDPRKDLRSALLTLTAASFSGGEEFSLVVEATHDAAKIRDYLAAEGTQLAEAKADGDTYWTIKNEGAVTFQGDFAVVGTIALLQKTLATARGGAHSGGLAALLQRVDTGKHAFMVMTMPADLGQQLRQMNPQAGDLQSVIATADTSNGLALSVEASFTSAESASALTATMQGLVDQAAKDPSMQQMGLSAVIGSATIAADGATMTLQVAMPTDTVQMLLGLLGAMAG